MRVTTQRSGEHAFTLIEMMIAMVLVAGLLITISTVLTRTLGESGRSQQQRKAMQDVRSTMSQFGNDLRVARAPDRNPTYVGNGNDLGGALLTGQTLSVKLPGQAQPTTLDVRDIVEAKSNSFAFRADVNPAAGTECVRYSVEGPGSPLLRTVHPYLTATQQCSFGATLERTELIQAVG